MRRMSFFSGLAILIAFTSSAASAQSRIYSTGSSGTGFNDHSSGRGVVVSSGSTEGGVVLGASGPGTLMTPPSPAQGTQPVAAPANTAPTPRSNFNRPILIASDPQRERELQREREFEFRRHHFHGNGPVVYPYYVYPPSDEEYYEKYTSFTNKKQPSEEVAEPEPPALTIFENRPGYRPPPVQSYQPGTPPPGSQTTNNENTGTAETTSAVEPQATTILVFRDGHQLEIGNYAIVGNTLYNMAGANETHKILLTDLDLDKTIKINQARGYDFRLPKRQGS